MEDFDLGAADAMIEGNLPPELRGNASPLKNPCRAVFSMEAELDQAASFGTSIIEAEVQADGTLVQKLRHIKGVGREVYKMVEYVQITIPGDKNNIVYHRVGERDKAMYPRQYAAFKAGIDQDGASGILLTRWPQINKAQVAEYNYKNVKTVEQLAGMSDGACSEMGPGALELRKKAQDYLATIRGASVTSMQGELEKMRQELALLKAQAQAQADKKKQ